jgi:rubrerythrin
MSRHDHHHHSHDHSHQDDLHHNHEASHSHSDTSESDKLIKMVEHWVHHNEDHSRSYRDWADRARALGHTEVGTMLDEVAETTRLQNEHFRKALDLLKSSVAER